MSAAAWNTADDNLMDRDAAIAAIKDKAEAEGIHGSFKVFYDGELIVDPSDLPNRVDIRKVRVSAVLDQAC